MAQYRAYCKGLHFCGPEVKLMVQELPRPFDVTLIREPANPYDSNAIEVHYDDIRIGHVAKEVAEWLAPRMDNAEKFSSEVTDIEEHGKAVWLCLTIRPTVEA